MASNTSTSETVMVLVTSPTKSSNRFTELTTFAFLGSANNSTLGYKIWNITPDNGSDVTTIDASNFTSVVFTHVSKYDLWAMVLICVVLSLLILATILGNVFVISAILLERSLRGVSNYLILSLAVTDLLVAIFVMPLSLVNEISVNWYLGKELCDFWISMDVLCCTASILHLVAISLDRFWGVSNIDYIRRRCARQILVMIAVVWIVSVSISIPPLFGWRHPDNNPEILGMCLISQDRAYTVFSTIGAFYCPMTLMIILNCKIYVVARTRIRKKNFKRPMSSTVTNAELRTNGRSSSLSDFSQDGYTNYNGSVAVTCAQNEDSNMQMTEVDPDVSNTTKFGYLAVPVTTKPIYHGNKEANGHRNSLLPNAVTPDSTNHTENNNHNHKHERTKRRRDADKKRKDKMEMKRERKAARVLGIITGAFIACWLPFFAIAVVGPFCGIHCSIPDAFISVCLWLGYFNSSLNPVIYTIFNPSFRKSFHKIIHGRYRIRR